MNIFKKITGCLLLLMAALLSFATCLASIKAIIQSSEEFYKSMANGIGYSIGSFLVILLCIGLVLIIVKIGLKLISKNKLELESIDEIGR